MSDLPPLKLDAARPDDLVVNYDRFSWLYDQDWSSFSPRLFPALLHLIEKRIPARARILDLCCGSGRLAHLLSERGYQVTGMDNSPEMLKLARSNAPRCRFLAGDARSFEIDRTFQAVLSTYDSLNHLLSAREIKSAFRRVFASLESGGIFAFDLNTEQGYLSDWRDYCEVREGQNYFYLNRARYDRRTRLGETHCILFRRQNDSWRRSEIRLSEKCYPAEAVERWLKSAGFIHIRKYSLDRSLQRQRYAPDALRVLFSCRKPTDL